MRTGMKIWIILASIMLFWGGVFCFVCCSDNLENRATDMAEKALRASVHNPESIRIMGLILQRRNYSIRKNISSISDVSYF